MKTKTLLLLFLFSCMNAYSQIDTLPFGDNKKGAVLDTTGNTAKSGEVELTKDLCSVNLKSASESYNFGDFDKVIANLTPCIQKDYYEDENMVDALVLLASTYCAADDYGNARKYINEILTQEPDFRVRNDDLIQFKIIFEEEKRRRAGAQVSSVSKFSESLYEAPATVMLITEEQIKARGYMDLEQLLHDIPGFDISRSNGIVYSHIFQRGYRMPNTNRILLLIDGIEENSLWGNTMYLSRQYPLSNIKSVEVIYGPVSTVYGPNGFLGVISINTKSPGEFLPKSDNISITGEVGYGQWNTQYADATVAFTYPKQNIDLSFTYRHFRSDEPNFGELDTWNDFKPWTLDDPFTRLDGAGNPIYNTVRDLYTDQLTITNDSSAQAFLNENQNHEFSNFFQDTLINGELHIVPTELGLNRALALDNDVVASQEYSDYTRTNMFSMRFRFRNLQAGYHHWIKQEGIGLWFSDVQYGSQEFWSPRSTAAFVKYEQQLQKKFLFSSFARYKLQSFDQKNYLTKLSGYRNGLSLYDLLDQRASAYNTTYYSTHSNQVRLENRLYYLPSIYRSGMIGMENRLSSIQDNYHISDEPNPANDQGNGANVNHYFANDIGFFVQFSQKFEEFSEKLKDVSATAGFRWDQNQVHDERRINPNVTYRTVFLYHPKEYIYKFIYSTAFKTPTNLELYSTVQGVRDIPNPTLQTEQVNNFELSVRRFLDDQHHSSIQVIGFHSLYKHAVETVTLYDTLGFDVAKQLQSNGERLISGIEATIDYHYKYEKHKFYFWGNYSYIAPLYTTEEADQRIIDVYREIREYPRITDMSPHKFNLGINYNYNKFFNVNFRMNYLGRRITGEGTTAYNMFTDSTDVFRPTAILHGAISYKLLKYGLEIQLVANNILDTRYFAPGIRGADGTSFSARLAQNPRGLHLKMRYNMSYNTHHLQEDQLIEQKDQRVAPEAQAKKKLKFRKK